MCVNTLNGNYIEKIYKKQVVLKKHSLQSDKVGFCVPIELTNSINMLFFFKIDLEPNNIKSILWNTNIIYERIYYMQDLSLKKKKMLYKSQTAGVAFECSHSVHIYFNQYIVWHTCCFIYIEPNKCYNL